MRLQPRYNHDITKQTLRENSPKIQTRKNSVFGHFLHIEIHAYTKSTHYLYLEVYSEH